MAENLPEIGAIYKSEEFVVETENITKKFRGKVAVDSVNMRVKKGEIYGLIGKNGAGKTTLMRLILGLCNPDFGTVKLFGSYDAIEGRKRIGSLIEAPGLYRGCSARENLKRFSMLYGASEKEIDSLLTLVGLDGVGDKKAGQFSLGMRQRLGIAVAMLNDPEVLILDEPINGLDPAGIKEIRDLFIRLAEMGKTLIISSHLLDELAKIATVFGIIDNGKLVEEVTSSELEERCAKFIKIATSDNEKAFSILKDFKNDLKISIKEDGIYIYSHYEEGAEFNEKLVLSGIKVYEINRVNNNLEDYFIERIGK